MRIFDRLRFRAGITLQYYTEDGDDGEIQIILYDVSVDSGGGGITVHKEQIINELCDKGLTEDEQEHALDYVDANFCEANDYYYIDDVDFIDQCTGVKDENGKLIYEEDILDNIYLNDLKYIVRWVYNAWRLKIYDKNKGFIGLTKCNDLSYSKIIGNMHENEGILND